LVGLGLGHPRQAVRACPALLLRSRTISTACGHVRGLPIHHPPRDGCKLFSRTRKPVERAQAYSVTSRMESSGIGENPPFSLNDTAERTATAVRDMACPHAKRRTGSGKVQPPDVVDNADPLLEEAASNGRVEMEAAGLGLALAAAAAGKSRKRGRPAVAPGTFRVCACSYVKLSLRGGRRTSGKGPDSDQRTY
jgi:hypothetical protein